MIRRTDRRVFTHLVQHNGSHYRTTEEMAGIFLRGATALVRSGSIELLPLSHSGGVDLLLVAPETVWTVTVAAAELPSRDAAPAPHLRAVS